MAKFIVLMFLTGCFSFVHRAAQVTEIAAYGSLACDAGSTDTAVRGGYHEQNSIMGDHPGTGVVAAYFVGVGAAVLGLNRVSPDWLRIVGNLTMVVVEVRAERGNNSIGVPVCGT